MKVEFVASLPTEVKLAAAIACVVGGCYLTSVVCLSEDVESHLLKSRSATQLGQLRGRGDPSEGRGIEGVEV